MTRALLLASAALGWLTRDLWLMWWRERGTVNYVGTKSI